jgi:hypothetical protein
VPLTARIPITSRRAHRDVGESRGSRHRGYARSFGPDD